MNKPSLSRLYRRLTAIGPLPDIDAADLVDGVSAAAAPDGISAERLAVVAASVAASAPHAGLARLLRALQPDSVALAENVNRRRHAAHPVRARDVRPAAAVRRVHFHRMHWAGGIAACACAVVVLGTWSWQHERTRPALTASSVQTAPLPDRIFTSRDVIFASSDDATNHKRQVRGSDQLFHGSFSAGG